MKTARRDGASRVGTNNVSNTKSEFLFKVA